MDINMPVMCGWDAVKKIRLLENEFGLQDRLIIIAVSGFCGENEK
jgi:CheY-like chemotaxis protein